MWTFFFRQHFLSPNLVVKASLCLQSKSCFRLVDGDLIAVITIVAVIDRIKVMSLIAYELEHSPLCFRFHFQWTHKNL